MIPSPGPPSDPTRGAFMGAPSRRFQRIPLYGVPFERFNRIPPYGGAFTDSREFPFMGVPSERFHRIPLYGGAFTKIQENSKEFQSPAVNALFPSQIALRRLGRTEFSLRIQMALRMNLVQLTSA